ncbi:MAG: 1-acyl-sn-glycerol-3-phosphate acyltransferase [Bacteroidales bacterium]|nr:1-acyl-sn-glycerol-3-phosphate acyltransferase [Bacteroidales bacterium]
MNDFDDIRPYHDSEIAAAMTQVAEWDMFPQILRFIYPNMSLEEGFQRLRTISTVHQLQASFMDDTILRIIHETTDGFTYSGLQNLRRGKPSLFISNHRDITLDAFLLQHILLHHCGDTSHIVFGENLLAMPIIDILFRSNKLIRMKRGDTPRAFYNSLAYLSKYINHLIRNERQSVWIAQKNGRAKDGHDLTAPAMLKMLTLGSDLPPLQALDSMHIVPISVSYEWDPCDCLKAVELSKSQHGPYQKEKGEDLKSVITGIIGQKGHVHLTICKPLSQQELQPTEGEDLFVHIAAVIDQRIHEGYRLMPSNYAAQSLLSPSTATKRYTQHTLEQLKARAATLPTSEMQRLLLEAYAAPVVAHSKY